MRAYRTPAAALHMHMHKYMRTRVLTRSPQVLPLALRLVIPAPGRLPQTVWAVTANQSVQELPHIDSCICMLCDCYNVAGTLAKR